MTDKKPIVVMTTCENHDQAQLISQQLLEQRLAACIQRVPVQSSYLWQNNVCHDNEFLLLIKSTSNCFGAIRNSILTLHSYELPEIICLNIDDGLVGYLDWLGANTIDE